MCARAQHAHTQRPIYTSAHIHIFRKKIKLGNKHAPSSLLPLVNDNRKIQFWLCNTMLLTNQMNIIQGPWTNMSKRINKFNLRDLYYSPRLKPCLHRFYYKIFLRGYLIKGHKDKNKAHEQQKTFSLSCNNDFLGLHLI